MLSDVSFNVAEGEIFGLLGPSGAGKTTIINILTNQLKADAGNKKVNKFHQNNNCATFYPRSLPDTLV